MHFFLNFLQCGMNFIFKRVVALDLRGFNESDKPSEVHNYRIENLVTDLKAFIEYLGTQYSCPSKTHCHKSD